MDRNPLPSCPDEELVCKAQQGDAEALSRLVSRYLPRIRRQAGRYSPGPLDREDFIQEGLIGLVGAVKSYDPARGVSFQNYCSLCAVSKMLSGIHHLSGKKHQPMHNYLPIHQLEQTGEGGRLSAQRADPLELYLEREAAEGMWRNMKTLLSGLEQETLSLYLSGHSYQEMAETLQISPKAVDNALQRVRRKLRSSREDG